MPQPMGMPNYKASPRAAGCDLPQGLIDALDSSKVFSGQFATNDALQTYLLAVLAGLAGDGAFTGEGEAFGFWDGATVVSGTALSSGKIVGNGTYELDLPPGRYRIAIVGDYDSATFTLFFGNSAKTKFGQFDDASNPLTGAPGGDGQGFVFEQPTDNIRLVVASSGGGTSVDVYITRA